MTASFSLPEPSLPQVGSQTLCESRAALDLNVASQVGHEWRGPLQVDPCRFRSSGRLKELLHFAQRKGRLDVCDRWCTRSWKLENGKCWLFLQNTRRSSVPPVSAGEGAERTGHTFVLDFPFVHSFHVSIPRRLMRMKDNLK